MMIKIASIASEYSKMCISFLQIYHVTLEKNEFKYNIPGVISGWLSQT